MHSESAMVTCPGLVITRLTTGLAMVMVVMVREEEGVRVMGDSSTKNEYHHSRVVGAGHLGMVVPRVTDPQAIGVMVGGSTGGDTDRTTGTTTVVGDTAGDTTTTGEVGEDSVTRKKKQILFYETTISNKIVYHLPGNSLDVK